MKRLLLALALVLAASVASAQVPFPTPPTYRVFWDHDGVLTDGYSIFIDDVRSAVTPTCTGVGEARTCSIPFPAVTPGLHQIRVVAYNAFFEGISTPVDVTIYVKPGDPRNVRIVIGEQPDAAK